MAELRFTLDNTTSGTLVLDRNPDGWESIDIELNRDKINHGINEIFSFDLSFHCKGGGKQYIDNIYETQGVNATLTVLIEYKCSTGSFETLFDGKVNFKLYESDKNFTTVNIEVNDTWSLIKSRYDTKIDFSDTYSLDGVAIGNAEIPSTITLHNRSTTHIAELEIPSTRLVGNFNPSIGSTDPQQWAAICEIPFDIVKDTFNSLQIPVVNYNSDPTSGGTDYFNANIESGVPQTTYPVDIDHTFQAIATSDSSTPSSQYVIDIDLDFDIRCSGIDVTPDGHRVVIARQIYVSNQPNNLTNATLLSTVDIYDTSGLTSNFDNNVTHVSTVTINANAGQYITICLGVIGIVDFTPIYFDVYEYEMEYNDASITITLIDEDSGGKTSDCKAMQVHQAYKKILKSITSESDPMRSEFFGWKTLLTGNGAYTGNGCGSFNFITNGYQIRQYPIADYPFTMSLKELHDNLRPVFCLGMGMDNGIFRVERIEFFYDNTVVHTINYLNDIKKTIIDDLLYSTVDCGYSKWKVEEYNGSSDFNNKSFFAIPTTKITDNKLNLVSNIVAGGIPIEVTRRKVYDDTTLEDSDYDTDYFIIACSRGVNGSGVPTGFLAAMEKDENYSSVTGVLEEDKVYNLRHSPQSIRVRNNPLIGSCLTKYATAATIFKSADADSGMSKTATDTGCPEDVDGNGLGETGNVEWDWTAIDEPPLFIPELVEFEAPLSYTEFKTIMANRYQLIAYSRTNANHEHGWIYNMKYNLKDGMTKFQLIRKYE